MEKNKSMFRTSYQLIKINVINNSKKEIENVNKWINLRMITLRKNSLQRNLYLHQLHCALFANKNKKIT